MSHNLQLHRNWGWLLGLGLLFIVLGCVGVTMVVRVTLASILLLGILFIIAGLAQVIDIFKHQPWSGHLWHALIALLYLVAGSLIIYDPVLASTLLTALLAWIFIIIGSTRVFMAFLFRHVAHWGWWLFAGISAIILGILILAQWPTSGLWVIGLLISIELLVNGWSYVFIALSIRR